MRKSFFVGIVAALVALLGACNDDDAKTPAGPSSTSQQAVPMAADAVGGSLHMFATLAVGEFDAKASPLYNKLAVISHNAAHDYRASRIDKSEATAMYDKVSGLRAKLVEAERVCAPDRKGKCTGDAQAADELLKEVAGTL